jgi:hypothetical protein
MIEPLAVPIAEAARLGGVGRSTIYNEIAMATSPPIRWAAAPS